MNTPKPVKREDEDKKCFEWAGVVLEGQPAHLFSGRCEAGALNTGQRSVGGQGCPAAIFSLAVSNETAQGPRKKGLLQGHPALPEITPETRPQKKHSVHTATLALDTKF